MPENSKSIEQLQYGVYSWWRKKSPWRRYIWAELKTLYSNMSSQKRFFCIILEPWQSNLTLKVLVVLFVRQYTFLLRWISREFNFSITNPPCNRIRLINSWRSSSANWESWEDSDSGAESTPSKDGLFCCRVLSGKINNKQWMVNM